MDKNIGVILAVVSSGGTAAAVTRYLVGYADAVAIALLRWSIGIVVVLPVALALGARWPRLRDLPCVAALGACFFGLFFVFYNIAVAYTTAARASLALATLPLQTMLVASLLGIEALTPRKSFGVFIAMAGVFTLPFTAKRAIFIGAQPLPQGFQMQTTMEGGCHCGRVRFRVTANLDRVTDCNCTVCTKKGFLHLVVPPTDFQLISGKDDLTTYQFNTRTAKHTFCKHCGIHPFYVPRSDPDKIDVNVRCLDDIDLAAIVPKPFDGKNWESAMQKRVPWR